MSDIEYSVIMSDVIKSFDCILKCMFTLNVTYLRAKIIIILFFFYCILLFYI